MPDKEQTMLLISSGIWVGVGITVGAIVVYRWWRER